MFPSDDQQQQPADNTTFSGSSLPTPQPTTVTDPFNAPAAPAPVADAAAPVAPTDPAIQPAAPVADHDAALNDFLSDDTDPSFLGEPPHAEAAATAPQVQPSVAPSDDAAGEDHDLASMKQQALTQLQPLVDHLDQSAEEQFKTTMMMIQATDDHRLLKKAFESAQKIEDDKIRAQALLDIINEINYFTTNQAQ